MTYCTYHSHSTFSDGKNTMEDMVLAAIGAGIEVLGLSDHSDSPYQDYCMRKEQYPAYLAEIERLQKKYGDRITLLKGIELDYYSDSSITEQLDYFLGSVHELVFEDRYYGIDHALSLQQACVERECGGDVHAFEQKYFDTVVAHIRKNKPTIVGHFDVITKFGMINEEDPVYQKMAKEALEKIVAVTPVLEVNTGAMGKGLRQSPYPADFLLEHWKALGGEVVLGADTHATGTVAYAFPETIDRLRRIGYDHILVLRADGFYKQNI